MSREVLDHDPEINWILLQLRGQLRMAKKRGNWGSIRFKDCEIQDGKIKFWQSGWNPSFRFTILTDRAG
jgi:hypothetical protein